MSARDVADMLAVAHAGYAEGRRRKSASLIRESRRLAVAAISHRDANTFFAGLQVALAETYDDRLVDEPAPDARDVRSGSLATHSPVDAGSVPHDGRVTDEDRRHAENLEPATAGIVVRRRPVGIDDLQRAGRNLR